MMSTTEQTPLLVIVTVVISWYASNILVVIGNKYLLANTGFSFPVFLTLCHMLACTILGLFATYWMPVKPVLSHRQVSRIVLLSIIFCATVVLSNASLRYIPVSFNQAIGATTPFFTAILALLLQNIREHAMTYVALIPVAMGIVIASGGEPSFHMLGFSLCLTATAGRALKTVVQSILMTESTDKLDPMSLLLYMCATCCVLCVPLVLVLEPTAWSEAVRIQSENPNFLWWVVANAVLAYLQNLLNFVVTKITSALTLQVLGNAKGVVAAFLSVLVFRNVITAQGVLGYAMTVAGVAMYSWAKKQFRVEKTGGNGKHSPVPSGVSGDMGENLVLPVVSASRATGGAVAPLAQARTQLFPA